MGRERDIAGDVEGPASLLAPVLEDIAGINMFFALETRGPEQGWVAALGGGLSPKLLTAEVEAVRSRLAAPFGGGAEDVEWRVGASLFHQGLASRVLSPVLAAALYHGVRLDPWRLFVRPGGPMVVRTTQTGARPLASPVPQEIARGPVEETVTGLEGVAAALGGVGGIAPGLLRGNTAAALAGAALSLGRARPEHHESAEQVVRTLLSRPCLKGTGTYTGTKEQGRAGFRRTTCCLYYRLPEGGLCGDCALRP
ncbi:(2Fe-2S)-binding protein [Nocardiopsis sp. NPDC006832]|uniref:(2Fe-2S)-binding protein n=1 Tax=Nocardiopsis sp. NPDC006832 TaxID=3157188 RepID=UPI0033D6F766